MWARVWAGLSVLLVMVVVAASLFSGMPRPAQASSPAPAPAPQAQVAQARPKVILKFLTITDDAQINAWKEILAEFQKIDGGKWSYVDIAFESVPFQDLFPKIESAVAAGAEMDLVQSDGPDMKHYAFYRSLLPLGKYFTEQEKKQWLPQSVEEGSYRGELYGPPMMQSCSLMMYNREMTDAAGIKPPDTLGKSWTMAEALKAWQKTTIRPSGSSVPTVWGLRWGQGTWVGDYEHGLFRRSNGRKGSPTYEGVGPDGITFVGYLDTPEAIQAMQFYQDLHRRYRVTPIEPIPQIFETKKAAFMVTPDNRIGELNRLYGEGKFPWGVTGIPYFKTQICHTGSWHYGISPNTKHFDEALAFVKFASSDAGARIWYKHVRQLPANISLLNTLPEYRPGGKQYMWVEAMNKIGVPRIQTPAYTEYQQVFAEMTLNIIAGANVAEQMKAAARRAQQLAAKYKGWK